MVALLLATTAGCFVLIFQFQKLYRILSKNNFHGHIPRTTPEPSVSGRVQHLQGLKRTVRLSAKMHHAELAEEIRAVTRMQMELTSQLGDLQTYLAQMKSDSPLQAEGNTQLQAADQHNYKGD